MRFPWGTIGKVMGIISSRGASLRASRSAHTPLENRPLWPSVSDETFGAPQADRVPPPEVVESLTEIIRHERKLL